VFVDRRKGGGEKVGTKTNAGAMRVFFFFSILFLEEGGGLTGERKAGEPKLEERGVIARR
jgi:hypothetical protein